MPLRRLTDREKEAHDATGACWGPGIIPATATEAVLTKNEIAKDRFQTIMDELIDPVGRYYMDANFIEKRLTPTQIVEQGRMTAAIAQELIQRIQYMEPNLRAYAAEKSFTAWGESMLPESGIQFLTRLAALMNITATELDAKARKTVTKRTGPRDKLLADAAAVISRHSGLGKLRAREVAADLLRAWKVQAPSDERKLRRAVNRTK